MFPCCLGKRLDPTVRRPIFGTRVETGALLFYIVFYPNISKVIPKILKKIYFFNKPPYPFIETLYGKIFYHFILFLLE